MKLYKIHFVIIILILTLSMLICSCSVGSEKASSYDEFMSKAEQVWQFQGVVLVAQSDSILFHKAYGYADISTNRMNDTSTLFLIGSMTKQFTAIATLQLVEEGLIDPDKAISNYLPDLSLKYADEISVSHLLSHSSGIVDVITIPEFAMNAAKEIKPKQIIDLIKDKDLLFKPGEEYSYSSTNYVLLAMIIENISQTGWSDYIGENICKPAGLTNTGVVSDYNTNKSFAKGYFPDREGNLRQAPPIDISRGYGAGSLSSTTSDLYKLNLALYSNLLLTPSTIGLMLTPQIENYGYGWLVDDFGGHKLTAHGGSAPGYTCIIQRWIEDSICVVVLCNNVVVPVHEVANGLAAITMNERYDMPEIKTPITLLESDLMRYTGDYEFRSGRKRKIVNLNDALYSQPPIGRGYRILPESKDKFYFAHDNLTTLEFFKDQAGDVAGYIIRQAFDQDTAFIVKK